LGSFGQAQAEEPSKLTIVVDIVVENAKGQPFRDLAPGEVVVRQDLAPQRVTGFLAKDAPGHYELRYVPASGKAGAVLVRLLRPGTQVRGPEGGPLKPRVLTPTSPLETALTDVLERRPDAHDFDAYASVLRFGSSKDLVRHALAVEVPLGGLVGGRRNRASAVRIQLLTTTPGSKRPLREGWRPGWRLRAAGALGPVRDL
jgi:hypothetical protein